MMKTAMSALNEFCMRHDAIPHYEMMKETLGRQYRCTLTFSGYKLDHIKATGHARTKQNAKHTAAYEALKFIQNENAKGIIDCACFNLEYVQPPGMNETEQNYMRALKDICMYNLLPDPDYSFLYVTGIQEKTFVMKCNVSSLEEVAGAGNKKLAKQYAANRMINKLLQLRKMNLIIREPKQENKPKPNENNNLHNKLGILKELINICPQSISCYSKINITDQFNIFSLEEEFFPLNYVVTRRLEDLNDTGDARSELEEISKLSDVGFKFKLITKTSINKKCMVDLTFLTPPPLVVIGIGSNKQEAESCAVRRMLNYLKDFVALSINDELKC